MMLGGLQSKLYPTMRIYQLTIVVAAAVLALPLVGWWVCGWDSVMEPGSDSSELFVYCAAGLRQPAEAIAADYQDETGVRVVLQFSGSNTLLSQIEIGRTGDLFLSADESYLNLGRDKQLVQEVLPIAKMSAVLVVSQDNPKHIVSLADLLRPDVRLALANPEQAAIGRATREVLSRAGHWDVLRRRVEQNGVFKPTVGEVANDVKLGSVDAGIVWDAVAAQYTELKVICLDELASGTATIAVGVLSCSKAPSEALQFARYLAGRNRGLVVFDRLGYRAVDGDDWNPTPKLTFYAGAVNHKPLEPIVAAFAQREGVEINTVYNGCGILTAQMRALSRAASGDFPDAFMACDEYYLATVNDLFEEGVRLSSTQIVIAVADGNPKEIESLDDLIKDGVRVALGQPEQCTIGVLSRDLLDAAGIADEVAGNVVTHAPTSSLLVPSVVTGAADAALAYQSDVLTEQGKVESITIDSPLARAVQPYSVSKASDQKYLAERLREAITAGRQHFVESGFRWEGSDKENGHGS